jgi:ATP-dependent Lon protease
MSATEYSPDLTQFPLLPLRDVVVFPHMVIPLFVGRPKSIKAMEIAMESGKASAGGAKIGGKGRTCRRGHVSIGASPTYCRCSLPDGTVKVLVEGSQRAVIKEIEDQRSHYVAVARPVPADASDNNEVEAMRRALVTQFDQYVKLNKKIPPET